MRILELTNYSAGICGVWTRVKEESTRLTDLGHEVRVYSSDFVKGDEKGKRAEKTDKLGKLNIFRYPGKKLGGESFIQWFPGEAFEQAIKFKPEVIIAHAYRHGHTLQALDLAKRLGAKVFLVTHAPFVEKNSTRSFLSKLVVNYYDSFIGPSRKLKYFDKIIAITKWEMPYLEKLGVSKDKIEYIPNGIPKDFFKFKKSKEDEKILFLGRISPIKELETLILSMNSIKNKKIKLEIVGPAEEEYLGKLNLLIKENNLSERAFFSKPIYKINEKIRKIDSTKIFVLPSKREAMPQALIESMAREKIVISSDNPGSREIIQNGKNGYLFQVGNSSELAKKIDFILENPQKLKAVKKEARKSVEQFSWDKIIRKLEKILQ